MSSFVENRIEKIVKNKFQAAPFVVYPTHADGHMTIMRLPRGTSVVHMGIGTVLDNNSGLVV